MVIGVRKERKLSVFAFTRSTFSMVIPIVRVLNNSFACEKAVREMMILIKIGFLIEIVVGVVSSLV